MTYWLIFPILVCLFQAYAYSLMLVIEHEVSKNDLADHQSLTKMSAEKALKALALASSTKKQLKLSEIVFLFVTSMSAFISLALCFYVLFWELNIAYLLYAALLFALAGLARKQTASLEEISGYLVWREAIFHSVTIGQIQEFGPSELPSSEYWQQLSKLLDERGKSVLSFNFIYWVLALVAGVIIF